VRNRQKAAQKSDRRRRTSLRCERSARFSVPWEVTFDPSLGGPRQAATFTDLQDWSQRPEPGIKYYSGIATYRKTFDLPVNVERDGRPILLDLGVVHSMARVRLNGQDLGIVWCAPWRVDITQAVKAQDNRLEIDVANLWPNRLIGDKSLPPDQRIGWTTFNPYRTIRRCCHPDCWGRCGSVSLSNRA
jgi:hypothetical protein